MVVLDYAAATAALTPFSLHAVTREPLILPGGHVTHRWRFEVNWPRGSITFVASGFRQQLRDAPRDSREPRLPSAGRETWQPGTGSSR